MQLRTIWDYITPEQLKYDGNAKYQQAVHEEQSGIREKVEHIKNRRVTKFSSGWIEVWNPGHQRKMIDSKGYTVVWFGNGDVKQTFQNKVENYFCKATNVNRITLKGGNIFYFFPEIDQYEMHLQDNKLKEVVYKNGEYRTIAVE